MRILPTISLILLLGLSPAIAAETDLSPEISIVEENGKASPLFHVQRVSGGYDLDAPLDLSKRVRLHFKEAPLSIEMREVYTGAISDEGPWHDVPDSSVVTAWHPLEARQDIFISPELEGKPPAMTWPKEFKCSTPDTNGCIKDKRWAGLYQQCLKAARPEDGPCYTYLSQFQFKIIYKQGHAAEVIHLSFPGGC